MGEAAKGIPKYLFTTVAEAPAVAIADPTTTPASTVAVGACPAVGADEACLITPKRTARTLNNILSEQDETTDFNMSSPLYNALTYI